MAAETTDLIAIQRGANLYKLTLAEILALGSGLVYGTATLNFGAHPGSNEATVDVVDAAVDNATDISVRFSSDSTTANHTASDHRYAPMFIHLTAEPIDGVGIRIYGRSLEKMTGQWLVSWERN